MVGRVKRQCSAYLSFRTRLTFGGGDNNDDNDNSDNSDKNNNDNKIKRQRSAYLSFLPANPTNVKEEETEIDISFPELCKD